MAANRYRYLRGEVIMRKRIGFVSLILMFAVVSPVLAHDFCTENSIPLERQLSDIDSRETQLRIRLEELDEELLPAHIERPLAGIGSTRPEVLHEHHRKMLTIERDGLRSQLDVLEQSQASVESEIALGRKRVVFKIRATDASMPATWAIDRSAKYSGRAWIVTKSCLRNRDLKLRNSWISASDWKTDELVGSCLKSNH